jgi:hypothetical protein
MKYLWIVLLLIGCTPQSQLSNQRQAQDASLGASQASGLSHETQSVPITINCIQIFIKGKDTSSSPCFSRGTAPMAGDDMFKGSR